MIKKVVVGILIFSLVFSSLIAQVKITLRDGNKFMAQKVKIENKFILVYIETSRKTVEVKKIPISKIKSIQYNNKIKEFILVSVLDDSLTINIVGKTTISNTEMQILTLRAQQNIAASSSRLATIATINLVLSVTVIIAAVVLTVSTSK